MHLLGSAWKSFVFNSFYWKLLILFPFLVLETCAWICYESSTSKKSHTPLNQWTTMKYTTLRLWNKNSEEQLKTSTSALAHTHTSKRTDNSPISISLVCLRAKVTRTRESSDSGFLFPCPSPPSREMHTASGNRLIQWRPNLKRTHSTAYHLSLKYHFLPQKEKKSEQG